MKLLSTRSIFASGNERALYYRSLIVKGDLQSSYAAVSKTYQDLTESYKDIMYSELKWGSSSKEVTSRLGNPRYKVDALNDLQQHQVLFFKREILGHRAIVQCHFLYNQLYFVHIDFVSALSNELGCINELILKKYALLPVDRRVGNFCITDGNQNKLQINNDVTLSLTYISGLPSVSLLLEKQIHAKSLMRRRQADLHLLEL